MAISLWGAFGLSAIIYLYMSWRERAAAQTALGFFQAGRNMGAVGLSGTYIATSFALANAVFYFLYLGYQVGLVGLVPQLAWCAGFVVLYLFLPKLLRESGTQTLHEFISKRFGKLTGLIAAFLSFVGMGLYFAYEVLIGATIIRDVGGISITWHILLFAFAVAFVVALYTAIGGFAAVLHTDNVQWVLASIGLLIVFVVLQFDLSQHVDLVGFYSDNAKALNPFALDAETLIPIGGLVALLSNVAFSLPWQLIDMTSWQKISACDPDETRGIRFGTIASGVYLFFIPGFLALMIGVLLRGYAGAEANLIGTAAHVVGQHSPVLEFLVFTGFLAAMISTADTYLIGAAQAYTLDIEHRRRSDDPSQSVARISVPDSIVPRARGTVIAVAAIFMAAISALWASFGANTDSLFSLVYIVYSVQLSLTVVVLVGLLDWQLLQSRLGGLLSVSAGAIVCILVMAARLGWINFHPLGGKEYEALPLLILAITLAAYLIGVLIERLARYLGKTKSSVN